MNCGKARVCGWETNSQRPVEDMQQKSQTRSARFVRTVFFSMFVDRANICTIWSSCSSDIMRQFLKLKPHLGSTISWARQTSVARFVIQKRNPRQMSCVEPIRMSTFHAMLQALRNNESSESIFAKRTFIAYNQTGCMFEQDLNRRGDRSARFTRKIKCATIFNDFGPNLPDPYLSYKKQRAEAIERLEIGVKGLRSWLFACVECLTLTEFIDVIFKRFYDV